MSNVLEVTDGWVKADRDGEQIWITVYDEIEWRGRSLPLSVEEAVQFSRMIVKAAAGTAGLETASEGAQNA